jgi:hypothetical protein
MGLQLPITGLLGPETRSAVRSFQRREGLRSTGIAGPDTEEALKAACRRGSTSAPREHEGSWELLAGEGDSILSEEVRILEDTTVRITKETSLPLYLENSWKRLDSYRSYAYVILDTKRRKAVYVGESGSGTRFSGRLRVLKELGLSIPDIPALLHRRVEVYTTTSTKPITSRSRTTAQNLQKIAQTVLYLQQRPSATDANMLEDICGSGGKLDIFLEGKPAFTIQNNQYLTAKGHAPGIRTGWHKKCGLK